MESQQLLSGGSRGHQRRYTCDKDTQQHTHGFKITESVRMPVMFYRRFNVVKFHFIRQLLICHKYLQESQNN